MKWYYSKILRKIVKLRDWEVAIRVRKNPEVLLDMSADNEFISIANTDKYWFADPILFEYLGKTWLFVEAFNKEIKRGEIGVFEVNAKGTVSNYQTIISLGCHMSYPYVFSYKEEIYMIPETGADNKIYLYKSKKFPYEWEQIGILCEGKAFRDSTVYFTNGRVYMLTYERTDNSRFFHTYDCFEYELDIHNCKAKLITTYSDKAASFRPAGLIAYSNNHVIRNSQKCDKIYGESLIFWELPINKTCWENARKIKQVDGAALKIKNRRAVLTHTYSCTDKYEAVDYRTL